jgi:hypothetical protein
VEVNPLTPDDWLIRGDDGTIDYATRTSDGQPLFWRTTDAGTTWTGISLAAPTEQATGFSPKMFGYTSNNQIFIGATSRRPTIWRGTTSPLPVAYEATTAHNNNGLLAAVGGIGGEIVFVEFNYDSPAGRKLYVLPSTGSTATQVAGNLGGSSSGWLTRLDRFGRGVLYGGGGVDRARRFFASYQSSSNLAWDHFDGYQLQAPGLQTAFITHDSISRLSVRSTDGTETSYRTAFLDIQSPMAALVSDAQTRSVVALWGRLASGDAAGVVFSEDVGATWQTFSGPPTFTPLFLAVIVRGGG